MTVIRQVLGWLSWYIVATVLYAVVWTQLDSNLCFALPAGLVLPLSSFLGASSAESTYDVYVWSTSIVAVVCLHLATGLIWRFLTRTTAEEGGKWRSYGGLISGVVGWTCWIVVCTSALFFVCDEIMDARGARPSGDAQQQWFEFVVGVLMVALLHLAAMTACRVHVARHGRFRGRP